jgi:hypothetical protein
MIITLLIENIEQPGRWNHEKNLPSNLLEAISGKKD